MVSTSVVYATSNPRLRKSKITPQATGNGCLLRQGLSDKGMDHNVFVGATVLDFGSETKTEHEKMCPTGKAENHEGALGWLRAAIRVNSGLRIGPIWFRGLKRLQACLDAGFWSHSDWLGGRLRTAFVRNRV